MDFLIRPLKPEDRSQWEGLWAAYLHFYKSELSQMQIERSWQRLLAQSFNLYGLVAERDGTLVGLTHYLFHPSSWTELEYCYLQDLYVLDTHRGQGVARGLIEAVAEQARQRPAQRVYWLTQEDNQTARLLYDKVAKPTGFIQYRIAPI